MDKSVSDLSDFLSSLGPGPVSKSQHQTLIHLLQQCWAQFEGSSESRMSAQKLERIEEPNWNPPRLSFTIERHGAMKYGSSRAELQPWVVDIDQMYATFPQHVVRYRQTDALASQYRKEPHARKDARDIVHAMITGGTHDAVVRRGPVVHIKHDRVKGLTDAARQTITARFRRLREAIREEIAARSISRFKEKRPYGPLSYYDLEFKVDLNSADQEALESISYVGTKMAQQIIKGRPWSSLDELTKLPRITPERLRQIKEQGFATVD